jgi:hypothetical protein
MKTYFYKICMTILFLCFLSSCSDENNDVLTPAEINAQNIQEIIDSENPSIINAYEYKWSVGMQRNDWVFIVGTSNYELEGTFIRIDNYYFNLEKLVHYYLNGNGLSLYFSLDK